MSARRKASTNDVARGPRVSFLGPPGTFSELAARTAFGRHARFEPASAVHEVFERVERGDCDAGIVPVENSTEGSVTLATDGLLRGGVRIQRELALRIDLVLMTRARSLRAVREVRSHPQALAQSRTWLRRNLPQAELIAASSTASAALAAARDPTVAAVGSALAAEAHGLRVARAAIQDRSTNTTRFLVLAQRDAAPTGDDKTTLAFRVPHRRGALRRVLSALEDAGVNLCRIESRPSGAPWEYVFLVDVEGHRADPHLREALRALGAVAQDVQVLGSYPRAPKSRKVKTVKPRAPKVTARRASPRAR